MIRIHSLNKQHQIFFFQYYVFISSFLVFVGLPKTIELRPVAGGENLPANLLALEQPEATAGEKKRGRALSSPSSERKKPKRRLDHKPKESSSSQVLDSGLLYRLRDEPEEDEFLWPTSCLSLRRRWQPRVK